MTKFNLLKLSLILSLSLGLIGCGNDREEPANTLGRFGPSPLKSIPQMGVY